MAAAPSSAPYFGIREEDLRQQLQHQQPPPSSSTPSSPGAAPPPPAPQTKKRRNLPGTPNPDAEVIALSPKTLMATNRFICEVCNKGFQREQNLQLHRRGHNLPWKLRQKSATEVVRQRVYLCPEPSCVHHDPSRALGDLTGIKKHFCRKHGEKKWKCDKCSKRYAVHSDLKAHAKVCGTREYRCDCGTLFSRKMPPKSRLRSLSTVMRKDTLPPHMHSDVQKNASHIDSSLLASHVQFEAPKRQKGREGISPYEPIGNSKIQAHGNSSESQVSKVVNLTSTTQEKLASTIQSGVQNDGFNMDRTVSASGAHFNGSHVRIQAPRLQLHRKSSRTQVSKIANHGSISQDRFLSGDENNASHVHSTSSKYQVQGNSSRMQVSKSAPQGPLLGNSSNTRVSKTSTVGVTNFMGDGNNASHVHTTSAKYQVQGKSSRMQVSVSAPQGPLLGNSSNTQVSKTSTVGVTNFRDIQEDNPHVPIQSNNSLEETTIGVADVPMKRRCAQRQRVLMAAITRANDFLDSTPADSNRDADRQVHISNEVLEAYYAEINGNDSSHVATSNAPISTVRKTRGPTQETTVLPPKGERWKCLVNDQQPVGKAASKLAIVLGLYARMEGYFPPHKEWNAGSLHSFNDVMKDIMRDYDFVDHEGMPANMMEVIRFCKASLQKKLRDWRCWLKSRYYVEGVPDEVLMKAPDKRVSQVNWEALLKLWETDKKVLEAERNKKNRGEDRATHTLGSKSIARHNQDLREQLREEYTTLGAYIKAHQTKTGEYPDEYTRVMCEKVIATCMERDIVNSSQPSVLSPILDIVYKRHHGGYERGRGLGWCRTLPLTNMEIQTSNENVKHLTNELEKAKSEIEAMHAREREMEVREREREAREREREAQQLKEKEEMLSREREMQERLQKMEAIISMKFRSV